MKFALKRYEEREEELKELIEKETNQYKRNSVKSELKNVENAKKLLTNLIQSLQSESSSCEGAYGRNPEQGETKKVSQVAWQVPRVALLFPVLGLAPLEVGGTFRRGIFESSLRVGNISIAYPVGYGDKTFSGKKHQLNSLSRISSFSSL